MTLNPARGSLQDVSYSCDIEQVHVISNGIVNGRAVMKNIASGAGMASQRRV